MALRRFWAVAMAAGMMWGGLAGVAGARNLIFMIDGSASMAEPLADLPKMESVKGALVDLAATPGEGDNIGLIAFGHRRKGDCADVETLLTPGPHGQEALFRKLVAISPMGVTALAGALGHMSEILKELGGPGTLILLADGQDTCMGDPCAIAGRIRRMHGDTIIHVIGLKIANEDQGQLACIAEKGGGRFFPVQDPDGLVAALRAASGGVFARAAGAGAVSGARGDKGGARGVTGEARGDAGGVRGDTGGTPGDTGAAAARASAARPDKRPRVPPKKPPGSVSERPGAGRPPAGAGPGAPSMELTVRVESGWLRQGPSPMARKVHSLFRGDTARVIEVRGDWNRVRTARGKAGWAHFSLFHPDLDPSYGPTPDGRVLEEVRVVADGGETKVIFQMSMAGTPRVVFQGGPAPRVICDFEGTRKAVYLRPVSPPKGGDVRRVRLTEGPGGRLRAIVELAPGQYRLAHMDFERQSQYMLIVHPVGLKRKE